MSRAQRRRVVGRTDLIVVGGLFSLTGDGATLGKASEAALELAARDIDDEMTALQLPYRIQVVTADTKLIFVASPNNPSGNRLTEAELEGLLELPLAVVVDEAYVEFSGGSQSGCAGAHYDYVRGWGHRGEKLQDQNTVPSVTKRAS